MSARARIAGAFAIIYVVWGVTFLAIRFVVAEIPPLATVAIRCAAGALLIFAWLAARGRLERTSSSQWATAAASGLLLFLAAHSVLAWAEIDLPSSQAALILTAIPAWFVVLEAIRDRRLPSRRLLAGLALGTGGVALLTVGHASGGGSAERIGLVFSALAWAGGSLIARHGARPSSAAQGTAMQLAAGAVVVSVASLMTGELGAWDAGVRNAVGNAGWATIVMWDIDTIDWRPESDGGPTAAGIQSKVVSNAQGGSIVLMHLGGYNTLEALPGMVDGLTDKGLRAVTLADMLGE